ncbi:MAG TPA: preprotein translocase subunit SecE [Coriobacteriia bacterium]|nr:preprotein translocase subunit SecE [Coriobacteriia bacterium]
MAKAVNADTMKTDSKPVKTGKPGRAPKAEKPGVFARLGQYFRDVRSEMRRVVWPGREEILNSSVVVVVTLIFFVTFTFITDSIVSQVLRLIRQIGQ